MNNHLRKFAPMAALAIGCGAASAQSLEDRVGHLERRVQQLEAQKKPNSVAPSAVNRADGWKSKANWRSLKRGMSEDEVRALLGEPHKVDVATALVFWHYKYPSGGSVNFDINTRRVQGWTEP